MKYTRNGGLGEEGWTGEMYEKIQNKSRRELMRKAGRGGLSVLRQGGHMSSLIVIAPAVPERWCTDMFKIIIIIIHKYVLMRTTLDKSQAHRFPTSTSGAPCQQVPSPVCRRAFRHFCASTPPPPVPPP